MIGGHKYGWNQLLYFLCFFTFNPFKAPSLGFFSYVFVGCKLVSFLGHPIWLFLCYKIAFFSFFTYSFKDSCYNGWNNFIWNFYCVLLVSWLLVPQSMLGAVTIQRAKKGVGLQNWINIYVLPFKAMAIMVSCCFFIHMNGKEFKPKIHLMKF